MSQKLMDLRSEFYEGYPDWVIVRAFGLKPFTISQIAITIS
jgi:hypothetical protein